MSSIHDFENSSEPIPRWNIVAPLVPKTCDLKSHLAERRSLAQVLAKRPVAEAQTGTSLSDMRQKSAA